MSYRKIVFLKYICLSIFLLQLLGCSNVALKTVTDYQLNERAHLYQLEKWAFTGRLGLSDGKESWTASIDWEHNQNKDSLKLSGPLGQGAVVIELTPEYVLVDTGDEKIQKSENIDEFVQTQLGVFVPVKALRYWVLGLTAPSEDYTVENKGFLQAKWQVRYTQMQQVAEKNWMPRKLTAKQQNTKLKLIIDEWTL